MSGHTYLSFPFGGLYSDEMLARFVPDMEKFACGALVAGGLLLLGSRLASSIRAAGGPQALVIPESRVTTYSFVELLVEGFTKFYDQVLGDRERRHLPFVASIFFFILIANLFGLVPGVPAATNTVWLNVGMAVVVFIYFNYQGIREQGLLGYLKHFAGPIALLAPFMFVLEMLSLLLRILTLNLRLYWNIKADHMVVDIFTELLGWGVPAVFYVLGVFVCFMQAFIFTTLTMVYILLATQHEEGEEHH